jgi:phosphatidylserine/phosphatidylglycerophosphate/cardiolipin synthase-like enzyme
MLRSLSACVVTAVVAAAVGSASPSRAASGLGPVIVEPDQGYAPIYALLSSAKRSLDLTMYEFRDPQAQQALIADAARGVKVRVLLNQAFEGRDYNTPVYNALKAGGVAVAWSSTKVSITHQKSFVIDQARAVIMTGNLTSVYYKTSRDYAVVDTKAKDVAAIEGTFALDWANAAGTPATGADLVWSPGAATKLVGLIASAKHTLYVENEEMQEPAIVSALAAAAKRGVLVDVLMTDQTSWHANFNVLKAAGVHVRTFAASAPLYIHAKAIAVDSGRVFVGSQNFSAHSLDENRELGLITPTKTVVTSVQTTFLKDFGAATPW